MDMRAHFGNNLRVSQRRPTAVLLCRNRPGDTEQMLFGATRFNGTPWVHAVQKHPDCESSLGEGRVEVHGMVSRRPRIVVFGGVELSCFLESPKPQLQHKTRTLIPLYPDISCILFEGLGLCLGLGK